MDTAIVDAGIEATKAATGELSTTAWGAVLVLFFLLLAGALIFIGYCILKGGGWTANFLNDAKERHFNYVGELNSSLKVLSQNQIAQTEIQRQSISTLDDMRHECVEGHATTQKMMRDWRRESTA